MLASKGKQKTELISQMLAEEKYQREAFQALLLQQDDRALEITEQMSRIQNELAALTSVEMKKRDMKVRIFVMERLELDSTLSQSRIELSDFNLNQFVLVIKVYCENLSTSE